MKFPDSGQWSVLRVKSSREVCLRDILEKMELPCFLPVINTPIFNGQFKTKERALFAGYLFYRGSVERLYLLAIQELLCGPVFRGGMLQNVDQEQLDGELRSIHRMIEGGVDMAAMSGIVVGDSVEVQSGPWRGMVGVVSEKLGNGRLWVNIKTLGQCVPLQIDDAVVERIENTVASA